MAAAGACSFSSEAGSKGGDSTGWSPGGGGGKSIPSTQPEAKPPRGPPPGIPAIRARRSGGAEVEEPGGKLSEKPDSQEDEGRDLDEPGEEEQREECKDAPLGKEEEVGSEHGGNRPAGAHRGQPRERIEYRLGDPCRHAPQDVEDEIPQMVQRNFDVVAEDQKGPHVAQEMKPAAVEKCRGDQCQPGEGLG